MSKKNKIKQTEYLKRKKKNIFNYFSFYRSGIGRMGTYIAIDALHKKAIRNAK